MAPCTSTLLAVFLLLLGLVGQIVTADSCNQWDSCDECIANGVGCVWCPDPPVQPFSGPRCTSRGTATCLAEPEDPVVLPPQILREGPPPCTRREPCARCAKNLQSSSTDCNQLRDEGCDPILLSGDDTLVPDTHDQECMFEADGCTHTFYISLSNQTVYVEPGEDCNRRGDDINILIWIIPASVVGVLLLLGLLALLIVLCIFWALDRFEFRKFQHNLEETDWVPQENPIYVSPNQQYTNVAYKRPSRTRQE